MQEKYSYFRLNSCHIYCDESRGLLSVALAPSMYVHLRDWWRAVVRRGSGGRIYKESARAGKDLKRAPPLLKEIPLNWNSWTTKPSSTLLQPSFLTYPLPFCAHPAAGNCVCIEFNLFVCPSIYQFIVNYLAINYLWLVNLLPKRAPTTIGKPCSCLSYSPLAKEKVGYSPVVQEELNLNKWQKSWIWIGIQFDPLNWLTTGQFNHFSEPIFMFLPNQSPSPFALQLSYYNMSGVSLLVWCPGKGVGGTPQIQFKGFLNYKNFWRRQK